MQSVQLLDFTSQSQSSRALVRAGLDDVWQRQTCTALLIKFSCCSIGLLLGHGVACQSAVGVSLQVGDCSADCVLTDDNTGRQTTAILCAHVQYGDLLSYIVQLMFCTHTSLLPPVATSEDTQVQRADHPPLNYSSRTHCNRLPSLS